MLKPNKLMTWREMREQYPWRFVFVEVTKSGRRRFEEGIVRFVVETSEIEEMIDYCEEHNLKYVYQWVTGIPPIEPGDYDPDPNVTSERLTREQMQERYPNQWIGLVDVKYQDDDGITVESGIVKYANKTRSQLMRLAAREEVVRFCTRPSIWLPFGMGWFSEADFVKDGEKKDLVGDAYIDRMLSCENVSTCNVKKGKYVKTK